MIIKHILIIFVCLMLTKGFAIEFSEYLVPKISSRAQEISVTNLIKRCIGSYSNKFRVKIEKSFPFRSFKITKNEGIILIQGSDGVSVAKGFHYYIKYFLKRDVSWISTKIQSFPHKLPFVNISKTSASSCIYYSNVCAWSYSFAWWQFSTWRQHIDWMTMMGVTLTIAPIQEYIWHKVLADLGVTEIYISEFFAGPGFLTWQRMGNIHRWAGPVSKVYSKMQAGLQQKIVRAQRTLGITVAIPSFAGHVPRRLAQLYTNTSFTEIEPWNNFPKKFCCTLFLEPNQKLFYEIAVKFLKLTTQIYGSNHIYFCDPFNEIQPTIKNREYLNKTAYHIYKSMYKFDPYAVWLLQGWMFVKNLFWTDTLVKAFLTAVPRGKIIVLDLQSEQFPQYKRTHSFFGQPFLWCMLHNFGGTLGMHGSISAINNGIGLARNMPNNSMIGVGITPEGIYQNYVLYSLAFERAWVWQDFNLDDWFSSYSMSRYSINNKDLQNAWLYLKGSVYSYNGLKSIHGKYTITKRPSLNLDPWIWYNISYVQKAWKNLLLSHSTAIKGNYANYQYDLIDVGRQFLQIIADKIYINLVFAYESKKLDRFKYAAHLFRSILKDLDKILSANKHFLVGRWITNSKQLSKNHSEKRLFEINSRNQITVWGPNGQILDYATKQWSGVVKDYYYPRWDLFLHMLNKSTFPNTTFNEKEFQYIVNRNIELPFTISKKSYEVYSRKCAVKISQKIFDKWINVLSSSFFYKHIQANIKVSSHKSHI